MCSVICCCSCGIVLFLFVFSVLIYVCVFSLILFVWMDLFFLDMVGCDAVLVVCMT